MYRENLSVIDDLISKLNVMHDEFLTKDKITMEVSIHCIDGVVPAMSVYLCQTVFVFVLTMVLHFRQ